MRKPSEPAQAEADTALEESEEWLLSLWRNLLCRDCRPWTVGQEAEVETPANDPVVAACVAAKQRAVNPTEQRLIAASLQEAKAPRPRARQSRKPSAGEERQDSLREGQGSGAWAN